MTKKKGLTRRDLLTIGGAGVGAGALVTIGGTRPAVAAPGKEEPLPQVPRKKLGKTGQEIPILLFGGAVQLDKRFDPKIAEALRFGVNYMDAADCYGGGSNEVAVGNYLQRSRTLDKWWITTKSDEHSPEGLEATLAKSFEKMKVKSVDMLFMHALDDLDALTPAVAKTAEKLKKEGKIKYFGFSCHGGSVNDLLNKASTLSWIDAIMFKYNFRSYGNKELNAAIDACAKSNIGLIAMKTQGSEASFADAWKKYEKTGKWTKHQAVLKAVWADERITAAVSHMDTFEKLKQNVAAACDKSKLSALEMSALEQYAAITRSLACDGCDHHCNPAVEGHALIGTTMRYLMYHDHYGETDKAKELFAKLPDGARRLEHMDFSKANAACPNGIDVAAHMERAARVLT